MNSEPVTGALRFAQLSDPHLTSLRGVRWRELANKRLLGYLSWLKKRRAEHRPEVLSALLRDLTAQRPDHVVITGDLTHVGTQDEFGQARRWLETVGTPAGVTVIPGNHDAYAPAPWAESLLHWRPYMLSDQPAGKDTADGGDMFPSLRIRGQVAFIGLSSAVPTAPFLATGRIGAAQRERFERLLHETRDAGLFRVVLIHHSPVPGDEKWRKRLTDAVAVSATIERQGAELILHGHGHRALESSISREGHDIPVIGIPSASAIGHQPGRAARYHIYDVSREAESWRLQVNIRGYRGDQGRFVSQGEREYSIPFAGAGGQLIAKDAK
jgi:3',5'-cyclic AMP phosphodiesterase CpdA